MAMAKASCASGESAPSDMPAESKRLRITSTGSTSSRAIDWPLLSVNRSRMAATGRSLTSFA